MGSLSAGSGMAWLEKVLSHPPVFRIYLSHLLCICLSHFCTVHRQEMTAEVEYASILLKLLLETHFDASCAGDMNSLMIHFNSFMIYTQEKLGDQK